MTNIGKCVHYTRRDFLIHRGHVI